MLDTLSNSTYDSGEGIPDSVVKNLESVDWQERSDTMQSLHDAIYAIKQKYCNPYDETAKPCQCWGCDQLRRIGMREAI